MTERLEGNTPTVLIVEDEQMMAFVLTHSCDSAGMASVIVDSPEKAREALEKGGIDMVILDGLEGRWPEVVEMAGEVPVVLCTVTSSLRSEAKEKGIPFIDKTGDDLRVNIKKFLSSSRDNSDLQ